MRAALVQMTSGIDPAANLRAMGEALALAKSGSADMAFLPEMCGMLDRDRARSSAQVVVEDEDIVLAGVRDTAARLGLWVHVGSLAVLDAQSGRRLNRGFVIDATGSIRARYDKMHLFDVDLPTGESWRESAVYAPGAGPVVVETPWGLLGMTICYDLRFPALFEALTAAGATMLAVPAAFTRPTGKAHWDVLLRARAIENAAFVLAAAQCGTHEDGRSTYGHSLAIDPWGTVLVDAGEQPGVTLVDLDPAAVTEARTRIPVLDHRRRIGEARRS